MSKMRYSSETKLENGIVLRVLDDEFGLRLDLSGDTINNLSDKEKINLLISELNKFKNIGGFPNKK
jgi:hypothetical protein